MALSRSLFNEFRPLFRMLDDPWALYPTTNHSRSTRSADPFNFGWPSSSLIQNQPALNLHEENDGTYVVEAEVPGVKKENLDVRIGDGGRSLTIQGRVFRRGASSETAESTAQASQTEKAPEATSPAPTREASTSVVKANGEHDDLAHSSSHDIDADFADDSKQVGSPTTNWSGTQSFTRTVWLPNPINASSVKAKLEDGILTVRAAPANQETINVSVD